MKFTLPLQPWDWQRYRNDLARRVQLCSLLGRLFLCLAAMVYLWKPSLAGIAFAVLALFFGVRGLVLLRKLRRS